jgi:hypothetical protein
MIQASDFFNNKDNGKNLFLNPLGGFIGIGTTTPSATLDVAGTGRFTGAVSAASGSISGNLSVGGSLNTYSGSTAWYNGSIFPQPTFAGSVYKIGNLVIQSCSGFIVADSEFVGWPVSLSTILSVSITCIAPDTVVTNPTAVILSGTLAGNGFNISINNSVAGISWLICAIGLV